ncbi:polyprenyl synthetase family protein [Microbacterium terricola]|uniref:Geranylgeranyl pyrophosphate synthase n=1 Tax=Microbacterium terricola TaxID=344163 RepID=A0ABM8DZG1_9MICO|nr:polyprenyl synthetase family protein [Microbacterium terricola]UYK41247.1 polyprenyl synthetase family protein [Microbacterium terricola]BDV30975.1 geranylgeranyl pyrophosphate synthase [Microbacterium terricola]
MTQTLTRTSDTAAIDEAIDHALRRLGDRAVHVGGSLPALVAAAGRAADGGKRLRPAIVLGAFRAFDGPADQLDSCIAVAAAFELLHTAFVVHDDVIDHDVVRRGQPNVAGTFRQRAVVHGADSAGAALLGDAAAILAGDLLIHEALRTVALIDVRPAVRAALHDLIDDAVLFSAAGELGDVENAVGADVPDTDRTLTVAHDKTAVYSFTAPLCAGALLAGADASALAVLGGIGADLGLAFQLVDDLLGAFGAAEHTGREPGGDLREAKRTPLVALARDSAEWPRVTAAIGLASTGPVAVREAQRTLESSGARSGVVSLVRAALDRIQSTVDDAVGDAALPPAAGDLIRRLAAGIEERMP